MSKKTKKPTRQALIEELESIHKSLVDDKEALIDLGHDDKRPCENHELAALDLAQSEENTLTVNKESVRTLDNKEETKTINDSVSAVLPGQQSLFDDSDAPSDTNDQPKPSTDGDLTENPFLPKHVRDKLKQEKKAVQAIKKLNDPIDKEAAEAMVDELVAVYLPKIELELREKLKTKIEDLVKDD